MKKVIEVSEETYEKIKDLLAEDEKVNNDYDHLVGTKVFIRTVTYHCTGKIESIMGKFFELSDGAWIADSGRFSDAIKTGTLDEVEPTGKMWVAIDAIVDMFPWVHKLPTEKK